MEVMKMRIKKLLLSCLLILSSIATTGCLERVDLNHLGIVSGIAIDKTDDGYTVTTQILNPAVITGNLTNALPVYSLSEEGRSIEEAYRKLDQITSSALFLSHLSVVVIDEEFAKAGFAPVLNFSLRHAEIRPDFTVVVAKGERAADVLDVITALDMIPAAKLDVLSMIPAHTGRLTSYNLYEIVDIVNTNAINTVLNAVSIKRKEDHISEHMDQTNGTEGAETYNGSTLDNILDINPPVKLQIEHLAVFEGDKLVGFIDGYEAQLYNIIMCEQKQYAFVTDIEDYYVSTLVSTPIQSEITTDLTNKQATIKLSLDAIILENTYPIDLTNPENLTVMSEHVQKQVEQDLLSFVDKVQTELKSDIFGIGRKAYTREHEVWQEIEGYWPEIFPEITINIDIELNIDSIGEVGNVTL